MFDIHLEALQVMCPLPTYRVATISIVGSFRIGQPGLTTVTHLQRTWLPAVSVRMVAELRSMLAMLTFNPPQSCCCATPLESQHILKSARRVRQAQDEKRYDKYKLRYKALQSREREDQDEGEVEATASGSPARKKLREAAGGDMSD